jgi:hypothetical protein
MKSTRNFSCRSMKRDLDRDESKMRKTNLEDTRCEYVDWMHLETFGEG